MLEFLFLPFFKIGKYYRSCFAQATLPAIIFVVICYMPLKQETQIFAAGVMGTYYAIQMMVVIVGKGLLVKQSMLG